MENKETNASKKRERSTPYPGLTLDYAISAVKQLKEGLGKGPYSREAIAKALGHSSLTGPAARKVAALGHYGLLEKDGSTYSLSTLCVDILNPISEEQRKVALVTAASSPRLFNKLIDQYTGQSLPSMLDSILIRDGVSETAASDVVSIFTDTMHFVGLLKNGVLLNQSKIEATKDGDVSTADITSEESVKPKEDNQPLGKVSFNFVGGISLTLPRTTKVEAAIMDGELKEVRASLQKFADRFCIVSNTEED